MTTHRVRGVLLADYVRMIRGKKDVDWSIQLEHIDLLYLKERIDPERWYPMSTFERFGNAILRGLQSPFRKSSIAWVYSRSIT